MSTSHLTATELRRCGDEGCLDAVAGGDAVAAQPASAGTPAESLADVVRLSAAGHPDALTLIRDAGRAVGEVLAGLVCVLNPETITIGGDLGRADEGLLAGARAGMYRRGRLSSTRNLRIVRAGTDGQTAMIGAAILAAGYVLEPARLDAMLTATDVG